MSAVRRSVRMASQRETRTTHPRREYGRSGDSGDPGGGAANDQLGLEQELFGGDGNAFDLVDQHGDHGPAHGFDGLADRGQRRGGAGHQGRVLQADHRQVVRHGQAGPAGGADRAQGQLVRGADDAGDPGLDQAGAGGVAAPDGEQGVLARGAAAASAASLRRLGRWSAGPMMAPMRVWPSEDRWPKACSLATTSSVETRGKPSWSTAALTSMTGTPRWCSKR